MVTGRATAGCSNRTASIADLSLVGGMTASCYLVSLYLATVGWKGSSVGVRVWRGAYIGKSDG